MANGFRRFRDSVPQLCDISALEERLVSAAGIGHSPRTMFRQLTEKVYASPQIGLDKVAEAKALGVALIVNNRPEGESEGQTPGSEIAAAAQAAGIDYVAIPVTHAGFSEAQVYAMREALDKASDAPMLAYCRSGTRSTLLWALAEASAGADPASLSQAAAAAGYDLTPIAPLMDMLAARVR